MAFPPRDKADPTVSQDAPAFLKRKAVGRGRRRKTGKVAPAQKALMQGSRPMHGGRR